MFYSDNETKLNDEQFMEELEKVRTLFRDHKDEIETERDYLAEEINDMITNYRVRTPEVLARLDAYELRLKAFQEKMHHCHEILEESLTRQFHSIYQQIKIKADAGNLDALLAKEDLEPDYKAMLQMKLDDNMQ